MVTRTAKTVRKKMKTKTSEVSVGGLATRQSPNLTSIIEVWYNESTRSEKGNQMTKNQIELYYLLLKMGRISKKDNYEFVRLIDFADEIIEALNPKKEATR